MCLNEAGATSSARLNQTHQTDGKMGCRRVRVLIVGKTLCAHCVVQSSTLIEDGLKGSACLLRGSFVDADGRWLLQWKKWAQSVRLLLSELMKATPVS